MILVDACVLSISLINMTTNFTCKSLLTSIINMIDSKMCPNRKHNLLPWLQKIQIIDGVSIIYYQAT
jgi:hypothetical protein